MGRTGASLRALCGAAAAAAMLAGGGVASGQDLVPWPQSVEVEQGELAVTGPFKITWAGFRDARLERAAQRFQADIGRRTGLPDARPGPSLTIDVKGDDPGRTTLAAREGYSLQVDGSGVRIVAEGPDGVLRGLATLRQMVETRGAGFAIPAARIEDRPRFPWRGLMIDTARHFVSLDLLKRQIDMMERVKLNVLHLHLSDNEGFRVESLRYPRLTEVASHGQFYTQAEIRELVAYAADRGVRIVPEIDVPGHTGAILIAYPELSAGPIDPNNRLALFSVAMDPTKPATYAFIRGLFEEMAGLFPDAYFHVGGDEVSASAWTSNPQIKAFMARHGYADQHALQDHFFREVKAIADDLGKTVMGWEEVAHQPIADDVVVQPWRSSEATGHVTAQGNKVVVASGYYLDLLWPGTKHYAVDPEDVFAVPPNFPNEVLGPKPAAPLSEAQRDMVLGAEASLWTETTTEEMLESRLWPRAGLLAERFWSSAAVRDPSDATRRMIAVQEGLRLQGLGDAATRHRMAARLAPADAAAVETLASATAPVRNMGRLNAVFAALRAGRAPKLPDLNQPPDVAAPDSLEMYRLAAWTDRYLKGDAAAAPLLRAELARYRDNHPRFAAAARGTQALEAALPISEDVSALARTGLEAIDLLERRRKPDAAWRAAAQALVARQAEAEQASASIPVSIQGKPQPPALLLIILTPIVERLVEAAGS